MHPKAFTATLIILILSGCHTAVRQLPYQQLLDDPVVAFEGKEQRFVSFFETEPVFRFRVDNPDPMGLPLKKMTFNLTILDQKFIAGVSDQDVLIRPADAEIVELSLPFNFMDIFDTADAFQKTRYARFDLSGDIAVGPFSIPYDISGEFEIPRIPSVAVAEIRTQGHSPAQRRMTMTLVLSNPNPFSTPPGFLEYSTTLGDRLLGEGSLTPIPAIDARQERRIVIPIDIPSTQLNGPLSDVLKQPTALCTLSGSIRYPVPGRGRRNFPFTETGEVPLTP